MNYWQQKIIDNKKRDERKARELKELGYNLIYILGCELKKTKAREERFEKLLIELKTIEEMFE